VIIDLRPAPANRGAVVDTICQARRMGYVVPKPAINFGPSECRTLFIEADPGPVLAVSEKGRVPVD
jgi:hypothetical protein